MVGWTFCTTVLPTAKVLADLSTKFKSVIMDVSMEGLEKVITAVKYLLYLLSLNYTSVLISLGLKTFECFYIYPFAETIQNTLPHAYVIELSQIDHCEVFENDLPST